MHPRSAARAGAFLFIVTSVVSAAFVLGTFSSQGDENPPPRVRLIWGALLGLLSVAMILSGSVESVKAVSELFIPISGEITAVNPALEDSPELVNKAPYELGWMIEVYRRHMLAQPAKQG